MIFNYLKNLPRMNQDTNIITWIRYLKQYILDVEPFYDDDNFYFLKLGNFMKKIQPKLGDDFIIFRITKGCIDGQQWKNMYAFNGGVYVPMLLILQPVPDEYFKTYLTHYVNYPYGKYKTYFYAVRGPSWLPNFLHNKYKNFMK